METPIYRYIPASGDSGPRIEFTGEMVHRISVPAQVSIRVEGGQLRLALDVEAITYSSLIKWVHGLGEVAHTRIDFGPFVVDVQTGTERVQLDMEGLERALSLPVTTP